MVGLALTYFFIYVVRQGVTSWFVFYLLQASARAQLFAHALLLNACGSAPKLRGPGLGERRLGRPGRHARSRTPPPRAPADACASLRPPPAPQVKGVPDAAAASLRVSGLELGGLFGSILAGKLSDMLINNSKAG